jgi:hypothetical protein
MHTALPGKIISFNPEKCTVDVEPMAKYTLPSGDKMKYPMLSDVPVVFPQSSNGEMGIFIPVKAGDTCLLVFCELGLDGLVFEQLADRIALRFDKRNRHTQFVYASQTKNTAPNRS